MSRFRNPVFQNRPCCLQIIPQEEKKVHWTGENGQGNSGFNRNEPPVRPHMQEDTKCKNLTTTNLRFALADRTDKAGMTVCFEEKIYRKVEKVEEGREKNTKRKNLTATNLRFALMDRTGLSVSNIYFVRVGPCRPWLF
jgi:hypothetical protein